MHPQFRLDAGGESAIGAGYHVFAPDNIGVADDALRNQLRVLNEVGQGVYHPWNGNLALREPMIFENLPLMRVTGIGAFEQQGTDIRAVNDIDNLGNRNIVNVGPFAIAPAQVQANLIGGNTSGARCLRAGLSKQACTHHHHRRRWRW